ncbi:ribonuclease R [Maridesulfovibrio bastinii]|uniref:ribonuclease R n=1 Tax=Maridesulfovibrio bastinii TaxID=47157 RepID=UPI0004204934|nr:ribonuclease R [Maridesulfovibrio bastinii]
MGNKKKNKSSGNVADYKDILRLLRTEDRPMSGGEIQKKLGLTKRHRKLVKNLLTDLVKQGKLVKTRSAYGLAGKMSTVTGKLQVQRSGAAFVLPDDKRRGDIFIHQKNQGEAWHGDRVSVAITNEKRGTRNAEGRVLRVLERGKQVFPVRVVRPMGATGLLCNPTDPRLDFGIVVEPGDFEETASAGKGDIFLVGPGERINPNLWQGKILDYLGPESDADVQESIVKSSHSISIDFPDKAIQQAEELPDVPGEDDFAGREDLRNISFVTIDGETARDFDDAVYVEKFGQGYKLWVAIADVSHYVPMNSPLDREAFERGNSYYFPRSVEPMFPKALSNGLCSLNPDVPRLAMAVTIEFDSTGQPGKTACFPAVILSHGRLTYTQVNAAIIEKDNSEREKISDLVPMLDLAEELARKINSRRKKRGSIEFDLPEPKIIFNEAGVTEDIKPLSRNFAHQIVEEFMIAANEAVAEFLTDRDMPCMYRVHPGPDEEKLTNLFKILKRVGLSQEQPKEITPQTLQNLIEKVEGSGQEYIVSRLLLRSMKQAKYQPENEGHFGLASECYCHFTSPIRRYADLVVHRCLKVALGDTHQAIPGQKQLVHIGGHLSARERVAMEAEREIIKRITMLFLKGRVGEEFTGVVSALAEFGFWIELKEVMAEGMVRLASLNDDYYAFWKDHQMIIGERSGRAFRLGQTVKVRLESVSLELLEAGLSIVEGGEDFKKYV